MLAFFFQLIAVLREVKYLEIRSEEQIPESAGNIYSRNDTFRKFIQNLDLTVHWYNKVRGMGPFFWGGGAFFLSVVKMSYFGSVTHVAVLGSKS